jgi:hypothetical protein
VRWNLPKIELTPPPMITINDKINHAKLPPQSQILPKTPDISNPWMIASPQHAQNSTKEKAH